MTAVSQIPRVCILWLLVAQAVVMLPHLQRLSWWMIAIWLLCAIWRLAMYRGEAAYPSFLLRVIVVTLGSIGIAISFARNGVLDIAVAALIFAFSLKLIEVKKRRDLYLVFYLAFFVIASAFLYSQSLLLVVYQSFAVLIVLSGLVATQQSSSFLGASHAFKVSAVVLCQAVPLMLIIFFLFPRIGPIWSVADSSSQSNTGMSESMSPGDISKLSQSTALVFTVDLKGRVLPRRELYWRGMTYEQFDGVEWSRGISSARVIESNGSLQSPMSYLYSDVLSQPIEYDITYVPSGQSWLFALPLAEFQPVSGASKSGLALLYDYNYETITSQQKVSSWKVTSYLDYVIEPELNSQRRASLISLPESGNNRARAFAQDLWNTSSNEYDFVARLANKFTEEAFYYTLEPPLLNEQVVDEFLFGTRAGFCEHYASTATFLLRAAGIPARVVAGYQGGGVNPVNSTITIRQMDAHVWVEYWVEGDGWIRFDPTAAVAPERVNLGLSEALLASAGETLKPYSALAIYELDFMRTLQQRFDAVNYAWHRAFVGFDYRSQESLFERWVGEVSTRKMAVIGTVLTGVVLLMLAAVTLFKGRRQELSVEDQLYQQFCDKMAALGLPRQTGEGPASFASRIVQESPELADEVQKITKLYQQIVFQELPHKVIRRELHRAVKAFKTIPTGRGLQNILPFPPSQTNEAR